MKKEYLKKGLFLAKSSFKKAVGKLITLKQITR